MTDVRHDQLDTLSVRDPERPDLRASDADRDRTAAQLGGALAVGRLTSAEYAERLDAAYAARTLGDARFSKVTVFRGKYDPTAAWQHHLTQWLPQQ